MADETTGRGGGWARDVLLAFGRGCVKILISLLLGAGAGLMTFGISAQGKPPLWQQREPPPELFLAVGVGMLTAGALMALLFMLGRPRRGRDAGRREPMTFEERRRPEAS
jgi:hypothetical protein